MAEEGVENAERIGHLVRKRGTYKGHQSKAITKLALSDADPPEALDYHCLEGMSDSAQRTLDTMEEIQLELIHLCPAKEPEYAADYQKCVDQGTILMEELTLRAQRGRACRELEGILKFLVAFKITASSSPLLLDQQIQKRDDRFDELQGKYRRAIRADPKLTELVDTITDKLARINSELPAPEPSRLPPPSPARSEHESTSRATGRESHRHRKLPVLVTPTFRGNPLEWTEFWSSFQRNVHNNPDLEEEEKLAYLQQSIKDKDQANLVDSLAGTYQVCVDSLKKKYDQPRLVHKHYVKEFYSCAPGKDATTQELTRLHTTLSQAIKKMEATSLSSAEADREAHIESLLPYATWRRWTELNPDQTKVPGLTKLLEFIELQAKLNCRGPSMTTPERQRQERAPQHNPERQRQERAQPHHKNERREVRALTTVHPCALCRDTGHSLYGCSKLLAMTVDQRHDFVTKTNLCYNCLGANHDKRDCRSSFKCRTCNKAHHTLLHKDRPAAQYDSNNPTNTRANANVVALASSDQQLQETLAPTLSLVACSPSGREVKVTALYDTGADLSFITNQTVNQLGLQRRKCNVTIVQALGTEQTNTNIVDLTLTSRHSPGAVRELTAVVVPHLGGSNNPLTLHQDWQFLARLPLANPDFRQRHRLDIILGQDVLNQIGLRGQEEGDALVAHETIWGWTVQGPVGRPQRLLAKETTATSHCTSTLASAALTQLYADKDGDDLLRTFFQNESLEEEVTPTQEDQAVLNHFARTHTILPGGRFQVSLPRKTDMMDLGSSRGAAMKRFLQNEKSLTRRGELQPFQRVMAEYFALQHAEVIPQDELKLTSSNIYYMPLHAVTKATSTSTKLRVVFDASAPTSNGLSLNDGLLIGPTVYQPLTTILTKFRLHRIGLTADISKMYREVALHPDDQDLHRFLWRQSPTDAISDCRMKRVTFGVASSPFMATQVLQQIAKNVQQHQPEAAHSLQSEFYVDDFLSGADTPSDAIKLHKQVFQALGAHKLNLRKWRSSSAAVLKAIDPELREEEPAAEFYGLQPHQHLKTLGVHWDSTNDHFHVSTSDLQLPTTITKRALTSDVARTFDVMGWFTPATMAMKSVIQRLWLAGVGWDDPVPTSIQDEWSQWRKELPRLADRPIPRSYFQYHRGSRKDTTLQGFSDASLVGYAAVVYIRASYSRGPPTVCMVQAKSKVAPVKGLTVPRLELCGALLLSSLITTIRTTLNVPLDKIVCWTDSQIVLHWLDGKSRPHRTFVANRVRQTLDRVPSHYWQHVPGIENPADCASRGINPGALQAHGLWWHGPAWLLREPLIHPHQPQLAHLEKSCEELVKPRTIAAITTTDAIIETQHSTYRRLLRSVSWCLRFRRNTQLKSHERPTVRALTITDVAKARTLLYKRAQARTISKMKCATWTENKRLRSLNPTKDDCGIFRVNGRLRNTAMEYAQRCPIILGGDDCFTKLLIIHHHLANGHAGPTLLMSTLGRDHYLINGMVTVKALCRSCVVCTRFRNETETQLMGQLPKVRVTPNSPFAEVGTDFAGPFSIKKGHTRKPVYVKGYICAFVCLTTKAVHLEVVGDLTTEAFLSCLTRFVSRRGLPDNIHSDNGSNYVGASRELEAIYKHMRRSSTQAEVTSYCTSQEIGWHFSPARAPHFGGIWESVIKSLKNHLRKLTNGFHFTMEELSTLIIRIEAALNSRPLMPVYSHSDEGVDVLTPGHFLIGKPLNALPEHIIDQARSPRSRHVLLRQLAQQFWHRWSTDYLRQLNQRTKWQRERRDVQVGDIVLIRGDNVFATNSWPMARVITTFPGADGLVRAVDLQTKDSVLRRPITKLTVLVQGGEEGPRSDIAHDALLPGAMAESRTQSTEEGGAPVTGAPPISPT